MFDSCSGCSFKLTAEDENHQRRVRWNIPEKKNWVMNLDNGLSIFCDFRIHDNLKFHAFVFHDSLQSYRTDSSISQGHVKKDNSVRTFQVDPQIIRVEDLEFPY